MRIRLMDSTGTQIGASIYIQSGSGLEEVIIPTINASSSNCYFQVELSAGKYCKIACPQLFNGGSSFPASSYMYLGSDTAIQAEVTASSLHLVGDYGAYSLAAQSVPADMDSVIVQGGIIQPMWGSNNTGNKTQAVGYMHSSTRAGLDNVELQLDYDGLSSLRWALLLNSTVYGFDGVSGHRYGDAYAWALYTGKLDNSVRCGFCAKRIRDGAEYSDDWPDGPAFITDAYWGCNDTPGNEVAGILGGHSISSMLVADVPNYVAKLGDSLLLDFSRMTNNRLYYIDSINMSPNQFNRGMWGGTVSFKQKEEF